MAGPDGILVLRRFDGKRWRLAIGYVGEQGLEPGEWYKLDSAGAFTKTVKP
jgi:hypothetical protein